MRTISKMSASQQKKQNRKMTKNDRSLARRNILLAVFLVNVLILGLTVLVTSQKTNVQSHAAVSNTFTYASVDTMKESMDTESNQLSDIQIAQTVATAAKLNNNYITVDTHWEYPGYAQKWVTAIRAAGKNVWFRMHPNAWEGNNGVAATMTPTQYISAEKAFIQANISLFQSGDILDLNPESENAPYWVNTYGANWTNNITATDDYNNFYMAVSDTATQVLQQAGITGVITTIRSTNSWFAETPSALYPSTIAHMGRVTIDSYPDQDTTDPATAVANRLAELDKIETTRNVPIVIAEFGYSNTINVDDQTQHAVVQAELNAMLPLSYIQGLNYWVGPGTQNSGGYTHLFAGDTGNWSLRPAASDLAGFFQTKLATPTPLPTATSTPSPITTSGTTYEAENGLLANGARVDTSWHGYSGTGYVSGLWSVGAATTLTVKVPQAGSYVTTLRYANATGGSRTISIYVNGKYVKQTTLPTLSNWETWGTKAETLQFNTGTNTIMYKYTSSDTGNMNLDAVTILIPTATPTPSPITTTTSGTTYEAENGLLANGARVDTSWHGYSGTGYVNGLWSLGASAALTVNVPQAGSYVATLRYANATGGSRTISIYVNGKYVKQTTLPALSTWETWGTKAETLQFNTGTNTIMYKYTSSDTGNMNLDAVTVK